MFDKAIYNGWTIEIRDDLGDEDCRKLGHEATKGDEYKFLDLSPYSGGGFDLCAAMIDLGFPTRRDINSIAPLHRKDVEQLWKKKFGDKPMPTVKA